MKATVLPSDANDRGVTFTKRISVIGLITVTLQVAEIFVPSFAVAVIVTSPRATLLKATVLPSDANDRGVTFTSSNPAIATVNEDGLVTGVSGGTTIIVVRTNDRVELHKLQ